MISRIFSSNLSLPTMTVLSYQTHQLIRNTLKKKYTHLLWQYIMKIKLKRERENTSLFFLGKRKYTIKCELKWKLFFIW